MKRPYALTKDRPDMQCHLLTCEAFVSVALDNVCTPNTTLLATPPMYVNFLHGLLRYMVIAFAHRLTRRSGQHPGQFVLNTLVSIPRPQIPILPTPNYILSIFTE